MEAYFCTSNYSIVNDHIYRWTLGGLVIAAKTLALVEISLVSEISGAHTLTTTNHIILLIKHCVNFISFLDFIDYTLHCDVFS